MLAIVPTLSGSDSSRSIFKLTLKVLNIAATIEYCPDVYILDTSRKSFPTHKSNSTVLFLLSSYHCPYSTYVIVSFAFCFNSYGGEKTKYKSSPETTELKSHLPSLIIIAGICKNFDLTSSPKTSSLKTDSIAPA